MMNDNVKQLRLGEESRKESDHEAGPGLLTAFWIRW